MNKSKLLILKAIIKGLAAEGIRSRLFINRSSGEKRERHWNTKRSIGAEARYYLLAYGLLRGLPYEKMEPSSNKDRLASYLFDYNYLAQICQRYGLYRDRGKWTPANLERLMKTGTMEVTAKVIKKVAS